MDKNMKSTWKCEYNFKHKNVSGSTAPKNHKHSQVLSVRTQIVDKLFLFVTGEFTQCPFKQTFETLEALVLQILTSKVNNCDLGINLVRMRLKDCTLSYRLIQLITCVNSFAANVMFPVEM